MATLHLAARPAERARFIALNEPDDIGAAVEEFLRFDGPTPSMVRVAVEDHEIDGKVITAGQRIYAVIAAANRDPAVFAAPDDLDVERLQQRHYAFGYGTHFCLGAPLARLEALLALPALHAKFPAIELAGEADWADGLTLRGPVTLPVRLGR